MKLSQRFLAVTICVGFAGACPTRAQSLLVVNQGNATVSVVDLQKGKPVATIDEAVSGVHGHEIAVTSDGKTAYLPIYGSSGVGRPGVDGRELLVIDVPSRKIVDRIDFGKGIRPHLPVLDEKHGLLYVTTEIDKSITVMDLRTRQQKGTVPTGQEQSHMLALSHDGTRGYTANVGPGTVSVLDMPSRKTLAVVPVAANVQRISISPDDSKVFTSDQGKPRLAVIDTRTNQVKTWVPLPAVGYGSASTPDGKWLLIAIPTTNEVAVVDESAMKVVKRVKVAAKPQEVVVAGNGKTAFVSCTTAGTVDEIDLTQWSVKRSIATGPLADGIAWMK